MSDDLCKGSVGVANEQVDAAILAFLAEHGSAVFGAIRAGVRVDYRQLDRRLQALRRAGKIKFCTLNGWAIK